MLSFSHQLMQNTLSKYNELVFHFLQKLVPSCNSGPGATFSF